ncbi:MAG: histidine phosphatase family protein [Acetobacteraceae bacterium]
MILLRHGESEFNRQFSVTRQDPGIRDPALTEHGRQQVQDAAAALAEVPISRIIVSPYTRAIETAEKLAALLTVPITIEPLIRERFAFTCDIGSPRSELEHRWPEHDFSGLEEIWWPGEAEPHDDVIGRAARFRAEMAADDDAGRCLVVSHWGFILALTGESIANGSWLRCDPAAKAPAALVWKP